MKIQIFSLALLSLPTFFLAASPAWAQLPALIPPVEVAAGPFTTGDDSSGIAARASVAVNVLGDHGVAASAWILHDSDQNYYALTGEYRKRFGPFSVGYWALGGGVGGGSDGNAILDEGVLWTAGIGARISALSVEGRAMSSLSGGNVATMLLLGYRF
ncbi:MAG: hypothetical protein KY468_21405 [Armatimonadetes bacterium]|nr:hypothetical protein [Armatimonadota bacterium]